MTGVRAQAESMDTGKAVSRLRSLASDSTRRSKTAVLRDVYVEIETAIEAGVSQVAIPGTANPGLEITQPASRAPAPVRGPWPCSCRGTREATTDFAPVPYPERRSFASTTTSGSLYDVEALSRLIRASSRVDSPPGIRGA
jgi:hypothetical protein